MDLFPDFACGIRSGCHNLGIERRPQPAAQLFGCEGLHATEQAMGRKNDQPRVIHAHHHREDVVGRVFLRKAPAIGSRQFIAVIARRFVSMVSIGDKHGFVLDQPRHLRDQRRIGDRPQAVDDSQVIHRLQRGLARDVRFEQVLGLVLRVWIQAIDLAHVGLTSPRQFQTIVLGFGVRLFVRINVAFSETDQSDTAHESPTGIGLAGIVENLVIHVNRRVRFALQDSISLPLAEQRRGAVIDRVGGGILGLRFRQLQPNEVEGAGVVEFLLQIPVNDIIGWGNDIAERADTGQIVPQAAKRLDSRHGSRDRDAR